MIRTAPLKRTPLRRKTALRRSRKRLKIRRSMLDALWSKVVRTRDRFTCRRCGKSYPPNSQALHAAHIIRRRKHMTRWDPSGGLALCYGCHRFVDEHREESIEFFHQRIGIEAYEWLRAKAAAAVKVDRDAVRAHLQWLLKQMGS